MTNTKISAAPSGNPALSGDLLPIARQSGGVWSSANVSAGSIAGLAQAPLVSGTNIVTINGNTLLASGNLVIPTGTGTVTSVGGTGTVSGLTLSGAVTTSGNLTLGGVLALTSAQVTTALGYTPGTGNGSVTSVSGTGTVSGLTLTGSFTTSGSLTLGGTLAVTSANFASQTGNSFLAGPGAAASGVPTFRAIVVADVPTLNQSTTGSAGSVVNAVTFNNGGAGGASGATFNGAAAVTVSYNSIGAQATLVSGTNIATVNGSSLLSGGNISVGTVTSVAGAGTVNGLTLTGTVVGAGSLTLGGTLSGVSLTTQVTGVLPVANGGTGSATATGTGSVVLATSPTLVTPALGAASASSLSVSGKVSMSASIAGAAPANIPPGVAPTTPVNGDLWTTTAGLYAQVAGATVGPFGAGGGTVTSVSGTGAVNGLTLTGAVTTSGSLTLGGTLSGVSLTSQVSGVLPVANGGTGSTTSTGTGAVVLATSPTLVTPALGVASATSLAVSGKLTLSAATASAAPANIPPGIVPTTPINGDLWTTSSGVYSQVGGVSVGPFGIGNGSVTSVSGTGTVSGLTLSGAITTSGSLALGGTLSVTPANFGAQGSNSFLAGPSTVSGAPTFRAMAVADVPILNQSTTGSSGSVANSVTYNNSGAGAPSGTSFNGSAAVTLSYNTIGAQAALVSGTNISTVNGTSLLTSGNLAVGTVTSVAGAGTVNGLTLTGTVTGSGSLTLGGTLSGVSLTTQVTGVLPVANGGTGSTTSTGTGAVVLATSPTLVTPTLGAASATSLSVSGKVSMSASIAGAAPTNIPPGVVPTAPVNGDLWTTSSGVYSQVAGVTVGPFSAGSSFNGTLTAAPITPASGAVNIGVVSLAGYPTLASLNPNGPVRAVSPILGRMKWGSINWAGNDATPIFAGTIQANEVTSSGLTTVSTTTTNYGTRAAQAAYTSAATAGSFAGFYPGFGSGGVMSVTTGTGSGLGGFLYSFRFMIGDTQGTTALMFIGLSSLTTAPLPTTDPASLPNCIGIGVSSADTSGNLCMLCSGATAGTTTFTDLGANFPANTSATDFYELLLFSDPNSSTTIGYTVNRYTTSAVPVNTVSGTFTSGAATTIPSSTTLLGPRSWRSNNAAAAAVTLRMSSVFFQADS